MQSQSGETEIALRGGKRGSGADEKLRRAQHFLVTADSGGVSFALQSRFGQGFVKKGNQHIVTATAGFETCQGGLDFVDGSNDGTPVSGRGFVQLRFGQFDIIAQARALDCGPQQIDAEIAEPLIRIEPVSGIGSLQADRA